MILSIVASVLILLYNSSPVKLYEPFYPAQEHLFQNKNNWTKSIASHGVQLVDYGTGYMFSGAWEHVVILNFPFQDLISPRYEINCHVFEESKILDTRTDLANSTIISVLTQNCQDFKTKLNSIYSTVEKAIIDLKREVHIQEMRRDKRQALAIGAAILGGLFGFWAKDKVDSSSVTEADLSQ